MESMDGLKQPSAVLLSCDRECDVSGRAVWTEAERMVRGVVSRAEELETLNHDGRRFINQRMAAGTTFSLRLSFLPHRACILYSCDSHSASASRISRISSLQPFCYFVRQRRKGKESKSRSRSTIAVAPPKNSAADHVIRPRKRDPCRRSKSTRLPCSSAAGKLPRARRHLFLLLFALSHCTVNPTHTRFD